MNNNHLHSLFCMKTKILSFSVFLVLFTSSSLFAEAPAIIFEENKNQWPEQVKFKTDILGGKAFFEKNTFTYNLIGDVNFHDFDDFKNPKVMKSHAFKVNFENSNPDVEISGNNLLSWHRNYYLGNDPKKWAERVRLYSQVYYKNLYSKIDLQLYNSEKNLKYDIIVHPGGDPNSIKLNYTGQDAMHIEYGHLYLTTSVGVVIEQKPYVYQEVNGSKKEIPCSYKLKNNSISFAIEGTYDRSLPLIIDPTLIACTYTGSSADNWGFTATYDAAGNIYTGGIAAANGYPTTAGASQTTFAGGDNATWPFDISITKFNPNGSAILYSTYYGGSLNEQPHSLYVNNANELYVAGRTYSSNFPATVGAVQSTLMGGADIIAGKFNPTGGLIASTFLGGTGDDGVNISRDWNTYGTIKYNYADDGRSEIILDNSSNVYVASCTRSSNFPTTAGAADVSLGGLQDGCVFKMNSTLTSLSFSTYLGGSSDDAAYGLKLDNSGNVYVTGGTNSANFPTTAGVLNQNFLGGLADGYIAVLNSTGTSVLRATYLGTSSYDQSYLIEIDASNDLYVFGQTMGSYPVTPGVYSNPNSGQFIHKVSGQLNSTIFSTVVGKGGFTPHISPTAFLVDSCQSIYISGWGRCPLTGFEPNSTAAATSGFPITANAQQSTTDGCDFYFMVLTPNAQSLWYATHFGENTTVEADHVDGGTSRFDKRAFIYQSVCASCGGNQNYPTTPWAYSGNNNSNNPAVNCNNAVIKMDVQVKPVAVANATGPTSGCVPLTVTFNNSGSTASDFVWDFGDGSPIDTLASPSHTYTAVGTYTLTLFAIDSIGICGFIDTATLVINIGAPPALVTSTTNILCNGGVGSATVTPTGGMNPLTYNWNPTSQITPVATGLTAGTYVSTVTDALGCVSTATVVITQPPVLTLSTSNQSATCGMSNGTATASVGGGTPGYTYSWNNGQTTSTATGLSAGVYSILVTDANGCTQTIPVTISSSVGTITNTTSSNVLCNGGNTGAANATTSGGTAPYTYAWSNGQTTSSVTGLTMGTYTVLVTDAAGCTSTGTVSITEPNALSTTETHTNVSCLGGTDGSATVSASGGTPGYSYLWSGGQTSPSITGLTSGTYSVVVTDANGCTNSLTLFISSGSMPFVSAIAPTTICNGDSAQLFANASNGVAPYSYYWFPPNDLNNPNLQNPTAGPANSTPYTVVVTDANGCTDDTTTYVYVQTVPSVTWASWTPSLTCEGVVMPFMANASSNAQTIYWDFGDGTTITIPVTGDTISVPHTYPYGGTYTVTLMVFNPPCSDTLDTTMVVSDVMKYINILPANVFTPNGDNENDCFHPALCDLSAITASTTCPQTSLVDELKECMEMEVYDRWGIKMFESTSSEKCWDGINQTNKKPAVAGTYYYIAVMNNTKIKGYVTLVR